MKTFGIKEQVALVPEYLLPAGCDGGHPIFVSDVIWILVAVLWWFGILHVWTAFVSPRYGPYRSVDFGFCRKFVPIFAKRVDAFIVDSLKIESLEARSKFSAASWKMLSYLFLNAVTYYCLFFDNTWFSMNDWQVRWVQDWPTQPTALLRRYYLFRLAYALHALVSVLLYEREKSDFWMYVVHHCVESALVCTSLLVSMTRIGLYLFAFHDPSDFWLQLGKIPTYILPGKKKANQEVHPLLKHFPTLCFFPFFFTWLILRLMALPSLLWWMINRYPGENTFPALCKPFWTSAFYAFMPLMGALVVLHLVWFRLIVKMAIEQISGKRTILAGDIRETSEGHPKEQ
jgi:hypothetical protein